MNNKENLMRSHHEINSQWELVESLYQLRQYKNAVNIARKICDKIQRRFGENHRDYAISLNRLAKLYDSINDYTNAEKYYNNALKIWHTKSEYRFEYLSGSLAIPIIKKLWDIQRHLLGENHSEVIVDPAGLYYEIGDYLSAEPLYKKALEISRQNFGDISEFFDVS
jgi:tetratricopeptide (TPR) repeat protein